MFGSSSPVTELERAVGQYYLYATFIAKQEDDRALYLAIPEKIYNTFFPGGNRHMDCKLDSYAEIVSSVVNEYAKYKPSYGEIELQAICDRDYFLLLSCGWNGDRRVHTTMLHLRIAEGKIWIERDETEEGIAQELLDRGVDKADIVLAFYHPEHRKLTDECDRIIDRDRSVCSFLLEYYI